VWTTSAGKSFSALMTSVGCIHVFGLFAQHRMLLALMKSAGWLPNHVIALEAL
jgi:hypothetical protein